MDGRVDGTCLEVVRKGRKAVAMWCTGDDRREREISGAQAGGLLV